MKSKIYKSIQDIGKLKLNRTRLKLMLYSVIIGIITGVVVVLYRISISKVTQFRNFNIMNKNYIKLLVYFFISLNFIQYTLKKYPKISGSGIPQVMGALRKILNFNWFFELIFKFISGILALFVGMSLGREGPSIHLGALIADGTSKIGKTTEVEKKYLITAGSSAGLAAAFNAPLSGTIFAIEELHKFFSPLMLICSILASISANFVAQYFLGRVLVFSNFDFKLPFQDNIKALLFEMFLIFFLSIFIVTFGTLFNIFLSKFQDIYKSVKISPYFKVSILGLLFFAVAIYFPDITGGGHPLIEKLVHQNFTIKFLLIILVTKFFYTMLSYSTGFPGGIFLPLLVIGALLGKIYGVAVSSIFNLPDTYTVHFMLLAMASYFAAIVKSPITGIVLVLEMTGNFSNLFPLTISAALTYIFSDILKVESVYEMLYEKMFSNKRERILNNENYSDNITAFRIPVISGSKLENKMIKEISWPKNMLIIGVERDDREFIPNGSTKILDGDKIVVFTDDITAIKELENIYDLTLKEQE